MRMYLRFAADSSALANQMLQILGLDVGSHGCGAKMAIQTFSVPI